MSHRGQALPAARRLTILPAAARLVEALRVQAEGLQAVEAGVHRIAAAAVVVVEAAAPTAAAGVVAEAAAAITETCLHSSGPVPPAQGLRDWFLRESGLCGAAYPDSSLESWTLAGW